MSKEKQIILSYLEKVNRPYSANDILQNVHKEYGKTVVQKALDYLVDEKKVKEKVYGKQKVYSVVQESNRSDTDKNVQEELEKLELEIIENTASLKQIEAELKAAESQLTIFQSVLTTAEAEAKKADLQSTVDALKSKLSALMENQVEISQSECAKIKKNYDIAVKEYRKRKRICMDMVNGILEGYPKSKAALIEEVGIELDDENNTPTIE